MSEWKTYKLGNLVEITSSKRIMRSEYLSEGIPFFRSKEIIELNHGNSISTELFISSNRYEEIKRKFGVPQNGDMLLTSVGTLGIPYLVQEKDKFYFKDGNLTWFRNFNEKLSNKFLFYWINSPIGKARINKVSIGSTQKALTISSLKSLDIELPPIYQQLKIVNILDSLSQKIQLNTQTNQTLEAIAQAIFKSWFVDFDPVRAKAQAILDGKTSDEANLSAMSVISGKAIEELSQTEYQELWEIADAFPSELVENTEFGEVPKGWEVKSLDEIANYQNGLALQKFRPENDDKFLPVVKIAQLRQGYADGEEKARTDIKPECIIDNGDVVFSWSGSLLVDFWCGGKAALNQHLFKVASNNYPKWFYYLWTKHHLAEFQRIAADKAVTMGHIKREHLSQALCAVPDDDFLNLCTLISNNLDLIIANRISNFDLAKARDLLLPRLLSGELLNE